jgi:spore coat polysaccharide biosynthesis protein SpsF
MKSAIFIAVRMKSTRLPKKALIEIRGKPAIDHLIDRLKTARLPDLIVLCTSTHPDDAILIDVAKRNNIEGFRGSEADKLERFLAAALRYNVDLIIAVDGDDILCDPIYIDKTIDTLVKTKADLVTCDKLPLGTACNGMKFEALKKVCEIKSQSDTEVWRGYFTDTGLFKVIFLEPDDAELSRPEIRLTLDYPEDYELFKQIFEELYVPGKVFSLKEVITLFNNNPHLMDINKTVHQHYLKGIESKLKKIQWKGECEKP